MRLLLPKFIVLIAILVGMPWNAELLRGAEPDEPTAIDRATLVRVVQEAYRATHEGWSSDEVVLSDELNAAFLAHCRKSLPDADPATLNWTLLNLRKAGELTTKATRRRVERHEEYAHAAEIAARFVYDKHRVSIDRVMCDPVLRKEFDSVAAAAAPEVPAVSLRRAAFGLRKARRLQPELVVRVANWEKQVLSLPAERIVADKQLVPTGPGVYIFRDPSGYLYIGESSNLRERVGKHLDHSDRKSLAHYLWQKGIGELTVEMHAFAADSDARNKELRRAYESELIRSRKPRFNIAP
jgi:predicted GIY-YIG superfamily endonuclease